jgi:protein ImuB
MGRRPMTKYSELYACLYVKEFPAQALLRLRPDLRDKPFLVMEGESPLQQVCAFNRKASKLGVSRGMTQVDVDTFPSVELLSRSVKEEAAAKAILLECAGRFSPRVEDRSEDYVFLCVIDIAGTEKLLGPTVRAVENGRTSISIFPPKINANRRFSMSTGAMANSALL